MRETYPKENSRWPLRLLQNQLWDGGKRHSAWEHWRKDPAGREVKVGKSKVSQMNMGSVWNECRSHLPENLRARWMCVELD